MKGLFKTVGYIFIGIVVIIVLIIATRITQQVMPPKSNDSPFVILIMTIVLAVVFLAILRGIGWMITHPMEMMQKIQYRIKRIRWW